MISDAELEAEALAADPDVPLGSDAVCLWSGPPGPLPDWYMPAAISGSASRWRRTVAVLIIVAFVLIYAYGLCSTYGWVSPA